jgi:hypothetical protein
MDGLHFGLYGRMNGGIDGGNIGIDLFHFILGLGELIGQDIEVMFNFLVPCLGHGERKH